jgi:TM2 domain-containing membrane protein YozV
MASSGMQMDNYQGGEMMISSKDKTTAGILGILLGSLGVHRMYMGYVGIGLLQLVVTVVTFGLGGIWGFIEGILILVQDDWTDSEGRLLKGNEKGQQAYYNNVANELKPPVGGNDDKFQSLKDLNELKEQGIISPEEFEREKQKIL